MILDFVAVSTTGFPIASAASTLSSPSCNPKREKIKGEPHVISFSTYFARVS